VIAAERLQRLRVAWYRRRWTCDVIHGQPILHAPALLAGEGTITFEADVNIGWQQGPAFLCGYSYFEAREPAARITFGRQTHLNNGVTIVSVGPGIEVGARCLIGPGVHIYDSDFHPLNAASRSTALPEMAAVRIGDDVFLGTNAIILKGVTVGNGSVVGAGAVVSSDVEPGAIVAGNPAHVVRA
jgi:acetyltransferase-like isoleucine patch superfamily enzyme